MPTIFGAEEGHIGLRQADVDFPGKGDIEIVLPPGSLEVPLHKAPSGHLVMVIDEYEQVAHKAGGLPAPCMQLHASVEATTSLSGSPATPPSSL